MLRSWIVVAALAALTGCAKEAGNSGGTAGPGGAPANLAGVWLPDSSRAEPWPAELPLTEAAQAMLTSYNPSEHDPTTYCMPLGTPRNMLQTEYPVEIVQTANRVTMILQPNLANSEVRRIPTDGSAFPEAPDPSWFGTSRGRWDGSTLVVETIGLRPDSLISGSGIRHSEDLRVVERLSLAENGNVLVDEIEMHDAKAFSQPLKTKRYFVRAPQIQLREPTSCIELQWIDKTWRQRLEEHAAERKGSKAR